jgi:FkbM family methyltransferase
MALDELTLRVKTEARTWARKLGLLGPLSRVRSAVERLAGRDGYEQAFDDALRAEVRAGDVVWDVGANVGLYTRIFSEGAGPSGTVCAFEPVPSCFAELKRRCEDRPNVRFFGQALGDREATLPMWTAGDPLGATHSFVQAGADQTRIDVRVAPGDALVAREAVPTPNVIKIDVEGFEEEVLTGMPDAIANPACRAVFIEVHFGILEKRGARQAPARIQRFLSEKGFKTRWTDSSHLAARRGA